MYSQGSLTDLDQKFQSGFETLSLMKAPFENYPILVSVQDKIKTGGRIGSVVHSHLISGMVGLGLWAPARLHPSVYLSSA